MILVEAGLGTQCHQTVPAVNPPGRQDHRVVFDVAFGMVGVRKASRHFVEFGGANGAKGGCGGRWVGSATGICRVTGWRLESGEAGGEGDVQEGSGGEGEEFVVGFDEEGGEVVPADLGVHGLSSVSVLPIGACNDKFYLIRFRLGIWRESE